MRQDFSLVVRHGKKGRTYYVRYFHENKMIPSQWSTKTGIREIAVAFSKTNREMILKKYFNRKEGKTLYAVLLKYYTKDSSFLLIDAVRGRKLNDSSRKILHGFIMNTFIPFLRKNNVKNFDEVTAVLMNRFQNYLLLEKKLLPQSINRQIGGIKAIFSHLYMTGIIVNNCIRDIVPLRSLNKNIRGCYSLDDMTGIFKNEWPDARSYLLCALIYTTGLRNSEIGNLCVSDIHDCTTWNNTASGDMPQETVIFFLNVGQSKTINGIRKIPLHPKVKESLDRWISEHKLAAVDRIFPGKGKNFYRAAKKSNEYLGSLLGKTGEDLDSLNISFYSGRHFYKTMLNTYNLGDIEELFMGHSVNKNVSALYNHKDKRGSLELLKSASRAIEIIDKCLFR